MRSSGRQSQNESFGRQILRSNILMIVLSLVATIVSLVVILTMAGKILQDDYKSLKNIDQYAYDLQTLFNSLSFSDETASDNLELVKQTVGGLDYNLQILKNNMVLYTDFSIDERWMMRGIAFSRLRNDESRSRAIMSLYRTVVYDSYRSGGDMYEIIAISPERFFDQRPFFRVVLLGLLIFAVVVIMVLYALCYVFACSRVRQIMVPVEKLSDAARRVQEGNYGEPVFYSGTNELSQVCSAFNDMQQHLQKEADRTKAYEQMRVEMIAGISHDLRTPLTTVKGYIKGVLDGIADTPDKQKFYLQTAYNKTTVMDKLLQQLFLFSKLETGNMPFHLVRTDMSAYLHRYVKDFGEDAADRGCEIALEEHTSQTELMLDADQMTRVLNNLVDNSIAYKDKEIVHVVIGLYNAGDHLMIVVRDDGPGVTKEQLGHVFDTYYRGMGTSVKGTEGSGLGLAIVKYIVEAHKGHVAAESGDGFAVNISLPLCQPDGAEG